MSDLFPLLARDRYTDEEWELASSGRCSQNTASYPRLTWCGEASDPNSFYRWCAEHDADARHNNPGVYGR